MSKKLNIVIKRTHVSLFNQIQRLNWDISDLWIIRSELTGHHVFILLNFRCSNSHISTFTFTLLSYCIYKTTFLYKPSHHVRFQSSFSLVHSCHCCLYSFMLPDNKDFYWSFKNKLKNCPDCAAISCFHHFIGCKIIHFI